MYCLSVKFSRGQDQFGLYSLDLTTISAGINGELLPMGSSAAQSHWAAIYMNDEIMFDDPIPGQMYLDVPDVPELPDSNHDGFNDFFDVSCGVSATTQGTYALAGGLGSGQVAASWSRVAGSRSGTCVLTFKMNAFQTLNVFTHTFEILEYEGAIEYAPQNTTVTGLVSMVQTELPENLIGGEMAFTKSQTDPSNALALQAGQLTNGFAQTLPFTLDYYYRDSRWPTNYYGYVEFDDGDLNSGEVDYDIWIMSIDDLNDADKDKIPDFSDTPAIISTRRPTLALAKSAGGISLIISADVGTSWEVQQMDALGGTLSPYSTVQITSDPQTVNLPVPPQNRFYRLSKQ
jgi:hypothetical protein